MSNRLENLKRRMFHITTLSRTCAWSSWATRYNVCWDAITSSTKSEKIPYNPWPKEIKMLMRPRYHQKDADVKRALRRLAWEDYRSIKAKSVSMLSASHMLFSWVLLAVPMKLKNRCRLWNELWYLNITKTTDNYI